MNTAQIKNAPLSKVLDYLEELARHERNNFHIISRVGRSCVDYVLDGNRTIANIRDLALSFEPENHETIEENTTMNTQLITQQVNSLFDQHTVIVKILDTKGKAEIQDYADSPIYDPDKQPTMNSNDLIGLPIGSLHSVTLHLTGKGSRKVDRVMPYDPNAAIVSSAPLLPDIDDNIPTPTPTQSAAVQDSPVYDPAIGKHIDKDGNVVVWDGSVGAYVSEKTAIDNAKKALSKIGFNFDDDQPTQSASDSPIVSVPIALTKDVDTWQSDRYYISPNARQVFSIAYRMLQAKPYQSVKIAITGESGLGKTTIAQDFSRWSGLDCIRVNCASISDPNEWFFDREVINDNGTPVTRFVPSEFALAIERGNCVIILDEFNRLSPYMHNTLFPLLDDDGKTRLHHREYKVGANVIFVATMNLGYKFTGTDQLDEALLNRFEFILEMHNLPIDVERALLERKESCTPENSELIVRVAESIRENELGISCSTRDTLRVARMVSAGMTVRDAFEFAVILRIPNDTTGKETREMTRKNILDLINAILNVRNIPPVVSAFDDNDNAINAQI